MSMETIETEDNIVVPASVLVKVERDTGYGSVPGLDDDELADAAELERWVMIQEWGPILALPVQRGRWDIRPTVDEDGDRCDELGHRVGLVRRLAFDFVAR